MLNKNKKSRADLLRVRARNLKLKADGLIREADRLEHQADKLDAEKKASPDVNQVAASIVKATIRQ